MTILYNSQNVTMRVIDELKVAVWEPVGTPEPYEWQASFKAGLVWVLENADPILWLNNTLRLESIGGENVSWLDAAINQPVQASQKETYTAFVSPVSSLGRNAIELYMRITSTYTTSGAVNISLHDDYSSALDWLVDKRLACLTALEAKHDEHKR